MGWGGEAGSNTIGLQVSVAKPTSQVLKRSVLIHLVTELKGSAVPSRLIETQSMHNAKALYVCKP